VAEVEKLMNENPVLTTAECRHLLETEVVGRVAFVTPAGPRIVPVNYALVGDAIDLRTGASSELAIYAPDTEVAFEIDHLDHQRHEGWSVIAVGRCERLLDYDDEPLRLPGQEPETWAAGPRPLYLRLEWRELSGRRVGGPHWPHPTVSGAGTD
jgi:nitroimidazol reductase NimA-like FMN-containing flavoprotein (pyridoxamine 5'-phosphate oxidase superfamily)